MNNFLPTIFLVVADWFPRYWKSVQGDISQYLTQCHDDQFCEDVVNGITFLLVDFR